MEGIATCPMNISNYVASRLLQDVNAVEADVYDQSKEQYYQKLMRLLQLMMARGANSLQYPPIRGGSNAVTQDMVVIYFGISENISIHSIRALVCIFTATFSMMVRYRHRVDIATRIADFFATVTRNLTTWNNLLSVNYETCF